MYVAQQTKLFCETSRAPGPGSRPATVNVFYTLNISMTIFMLIKTQFKLLIENAVDSGSGIVNLEPQDAMLWRKIKLLLTMVYN